MEERFLKPPPGPWLIAAASSMAGGGWEGTGDEDATGSCQWSSSGGDLSSQAEAVERGVPTPYSFPICQPDVGVPVRTLPPSAGCQLPALTTMWSFTSAGNGTNGVSSGGVGRRFRLHFRR